ncbi:MAG TPA: hypothetical protein VIC57_16795 [Candidatus Dormibacteraeota bacterium]|jgi:hypothetical protein
MARGHEGGLGIGPATPDDDRARAPPIRWREQLTPPVGGVERLV